MKTNAKHLKFYIIIFFGVIAIASFIASMMPVLNVDEPFTISLIKHSYIQICKIDLYDVHPPLYYLFLKLFLSVTTFWTKSVIIKIIFSRILSFLSFIISFYFLIKVLNILKIRVNLIEQFIFFFLFPIIEQDSILIRMYQFTAMFLVLEIYGLLLFKENKRSGLVLATIMVFLSSYTNYFAAMFAGALLIVYLVEYTFQKEYHKSLFVLLAGIIDCILFIPCSFFLIHQVNYVASNHYSNFIGISPLGKHILPQLLGAFTGTGVSSVTSLLKCSILFLIEIICLITSIKKHNGFSKLLINIYIAMVLGFIPSIILSIVKHPMIVYRYGFPIEFIIIFFTITILLNEINTLNKFKMPITFCLLLLIFILSFHTLKTNVNYDKSCASNIHEEQVINNSSHRYFHANSYNAISYSTYLDSNSHKRIISKHLPVKHILASNNTKLLLRVFSNISYKN